MDQATVAFHEEDNNANQTRLVIEGLSTIAPTAETNNQMLLMNQFMDELGDKYRRILKEHEESKTYHKEKFKESLSNLTKLYEHQARINMEHIITTQSSNAEQKMQQQLHKLVRPHIDSTTKEIIKQLNDKLDGYKNDLDSKYFEKESELISDLDHFQDRASLVLDEAMEDFYTRTVPYDTTKTHSVHGRTPQGKSHHDGKNENGRDNGPTSNNTQNPTTSGPNH
jgi:hypothetical protein